MRTVERILISKTKTTTRYMSNTLPQYFKACRKRAGFTQQEVAVLVGLSQGGSISRLEQGKRKATLTIAVSYSIVFGFPLETVMPKLFEEIDTAVRKRAKRLLNRLKHSHVDGVFARKCERRIEMLETLLRRKPLCAQEAHEATEGGIRKARLFF